MDYLASMYIDNEMSLQEKIVFIKKIKSDIAFYSQTLELIALEQLLKKEPTLIETAQEKKRPLESYFDFSYSLRIFGYIGAAVAVGLLLVIPSLIQPSPQKISRQFVIFEPAAASVELVGSFTDWNPVALQKMGSSGYWVIQLQLPEGQHRYSYVLNKKDYILDPVSSASEKDDFGGKNSILKVGGRT